MKQAGESSHPDPPTYSKSQEECEDGESKISFRPAQAGRYMALGHGKCLSVEDLQDMQRHGKLDHNPYNRQPFTIEQRRQIEALLNR